MNSRYFFTVDRPLTRSIANVDTTFIATNDTFQYITNSSLIYPVMYDQDATGKTKTIKTNPRLLYYNGLKSGNLNIQGQAFPYFPVGILAGGVFATSSYASFDSYPFVSHLVYPLNSNTASFDLNWGIPDNLYFPFAGQYPTNNLYTSFWRNTINEQVDSESRLMTAYFKLSPLDITNPDLLKSTIYIGGDFQTYFRINKIIDYNPGDPTTLTQVELVRKSNDIPVYKPYIDQYSLTYISSSFNTLASSSITNIEVGISFPNYVSGSVFPISGTQNNLYSTNKQGIQILNVYVNTPVSSSDTIIITDDNNSISQLLPPGNNIISPNRTFNSGSTIQIFISGSHYVPPVSGSVTIHNAISTSNITSVSGIAGFTFSTISGTGQVTGSHSGFTSGITVVTTGTIPPVPNFSMALKVNGTIVQCFPAVSGNTYNFSSRTYALTDTIYVDYSTGTC